MNPTLSAVTKKINHACPPILLDSAEAEVMQASRRQGRMSRKELSGITGWSKAKASQVIRSLLDKGFLVEVGEGASQGGRRPRLLRINNQLGYIVGIDIGATSPDMALADVEGQIAQRCSEAASVRVKPEQFFGHCVELINQMVKAQGVYADQILGIGIGVPGPVDFARGILVAPRLCLTGKTFRFVDFSTKHFPQRLLSWITMSTS